MSKGKRRSIFRVKNRSKPFVVIDKEGINDTRLSWKAKGILCYLLSLPDDWELHVNELLTHATDGRDSTAKGITELIKYGYCKRERNRSEKGTIKGYLYSVFEVPSICKMDNCTNRQNQPATGKPFTEYPFTDSPYTENLKLLNNNSTNKVIGINNQSINMSNKIERYDNNNYREILYQNIDYSSLKGKYPYEKILDDLVELIIDVLESNDGVIRINGHVKDTKDVKSVYQSLKGRHIEYVLECMSKNDCRVSNMRSYLITALFNAPKTINSYYSNLVNYDMSNQIDRN